MKKPIMLSNSLIHAIELDIQAHAQELGDELSGVEEVIGDNLTGINRIEYQSLIDEYGFDAVTAFVKRKWTL